MFPAVVLLLLFVFLFLVFINPFFREPSGLRSQSLSQSEPVRNKNIHVYISIQFMYTHKTVAADSARGAPSPCRGPGLVGHCWAGLVAGRCEQNPDFIACRLIRILANKVWHQNPLKSLMSL